MIYDVTFNNPNNHLFTVKLTIDNPNPCGQRLTLPNWIPGSYMIRDFSRNIVTIKAISAGNELKIEKIDKSTWSIEPVKDSLLIEYQVYAFDLSVRSAHLDNSHAFFNGSSLFLCPVGEELSDILIKINSPKIVQTWSVKTALTIDNVNSLGFGLYTANSYDELIDCPVEVSQSTDINFNVLGIQHSLHLTGDRIDGFDTDQLAVDLTKICHEQAAVFDNELPPSKYLFLTMVVNGGYGGLEHKSSTSLVCSPDDLPLLGATKQSEGYRQFLGLCSHEYFHLWNVKRIKPQVFMEKGLSSEVHTQLLWAFEGITSYYDDLAVLRSSCISIENYLEQFAHTLTRYFRSKGRSRQTLVDSSFDAWTKFYKQDENATNAIVSYYIKGMIVAFGLDMTIRKNTSNSKNLDDLMKLLWNKYGREDIGVHENTIEIETENLVGRDMSDFFDICLRSTEELPISDWLNDLGIRLTLRRENDSSDKGGFTDEKKSHKEAEFIENKEVTFGCKLKPGNDTQVQYVLNDSPAEMAGICPGDIFVAIDGQQVTNTNFEKLVCLHDVGKAIQVFVFRREKLHQFSIIPVLKDLDVCELSLIDDSELSVQQRDLMQDWRRTNATTS